MVSVLLLLSCAYPVSVTGHGEHNHHLRSHHHENRARQTSPALSPAASAVITPAADAAMNVADAQAMMDMAVPAMAAANKKRQENHQQNRYELQNATARETTSKPAPALDYSSVTRFSNERIAQIQAENTDNSPSHYSYVIPAQLTKAARVLAENEPPAPTVGDPAVVAARIHEKYGLNINDTNVPPQELVQPNGLVIDVLAQPLIHMATNSTKPMSKGIQKRAAQDYWMTTIPRREASPFVHDRYRV